MPQSARYSITHACTILCWFTVAIALILGPIIQSSANTATATSAPSRTAAATYRRFLPLVNNQLYGGRIALVFYKDNALWLGVLRPGDATPVPIATGCRHKSIANPVWSPDGQKIAFDQSAGTDASSLCVVNADGSGLTIVSSGFTDRDREPQWSPDGRRLVFVSGGFSFNITTPPDIYSVAVDGSDRRQLTTNPFTDDHPVWSPDGQYIAFERVESEQQRIYLMRPDGSQQVRLTNTQGYDYAPAWSPNSKLLAFVSGKTDVDVDELYTVGVDGAKLTLLTTLSFIRHPIWSPDGSKIAFSSGSDLYVINADGSGLLRLGELRYANGKNSYAWSPDSRALVFESGVTNTFGVALALVNVDGTGYRLLTQGSYDADPAWIQ